MPLPPASALARSYTYSARLVAYIWRCRASAVAARERGEREEEEEEGEEPVSQGKNSEVLM